MDGDGEQSWTDLSLCTKWSFDVSKSLKSPELLIKGPALFFFLLSFFFFPPSLRYICGPVGCLGKEMLFVITTTFPPLGARNAGSSDESLCCDGTRSRADLLLWMPTTLSSVLLFPGDCF